MKVEKRLVLSLTGLDHIIDVNWLAEEEDIPPSLTFLEMLKHEARLSEVELKDIDIVEVDLRDAKFG